ncbi:MAG TPA: glycosyl hydrolase family 18 protein [Patescibacteria group bacterium]|nr:glycosyl hydrolase family 18 protein [Patescibacteria group bacterium]
MKAILLGIWLSLFPPPTTHIETISQHSAPVQIQSQYSKPTIYGYVPYWTYKTAQLPGVLTDAAFFSLTIGGDGSLSALPKNALSQKRSDVVLSMMDQDAIPVFVRSESARQNFINQVAILIQDPLLKGISIDVEYSGIVDRDLQSQFTILIRSLSNLLHQQPHPISLTIASYSDAATVERLTKPKELAPLVDHLVAMTYDYHRRSSPKAGPVSPLYGSSETLWASDIMADLKSYTDQVPSEKILLGIPFYGYQWDVVDTMQHPFTIPNTGMTIQYKDVVKLLYSGKAVRHWDSSAFSPYLTFDDEGTTAMAYYDDPQSLLYKFQLVKQAHLGGIAIWALGYEGTTSDLWQTIQKDLL